MKADTENLDPLMVDLKADYDSILASNQNIGLIVLFFRNFCTFPEKLAEFNLTPPHLIAYFYSMTDYNIFRKENNLVWEGHHFINNYFTNIPNERNNFFNTIVKTKYGDPIEYLDNHFLNM